MSSMISWRCPNQNASLLVNMRGQCLVEMIFFVPLFLVLIVGSISFLMLVSWKETVLQRTVSVRLAISSNEPMRQNETDQLIRLIERLSEPGSELQKNQSLYDQGVSLNSGGEALTVCNETIASQRAQQERCVNPQFTTLHAWPRKQFRLPRNSSYLDEAGEKSQGIRFELTPVFDNAGEFAVNQRKHWRAFVMQEMNGVSSQVAREPVSGFAGDFAIFLREVARSGPERNNPPWNLTRDCLYSSQGMTCAGLQRSREAGPIQDMFFEQRKISSLAQATACAAEACARAPHPVTCVASAIASAAYLQTDAAGEPTICPATVAAAKNAHRVAKGFLRTLTLQKMLQKHTLQSADGLFWHNERQHVRFNSALVD